MSIFKKSKPVSSQRVKPTPRANKSTYTYYSKRSEREGTERKKASQPQVKRKKKRQLQHIPSFLLLIVALFSLLYLSTINPNAKIKFDVDKNTTEFRKQSDYQVEAEKYVKESIINRSKFLFDSSGLAAHLKQTFPELATSTVTVPIINRRPVVTLSTTKPAFILTAGNQSYLIGNNGTALIKLDEVENPAKLNLRTLTDESGLEITVGKAALPAEQAKFIAVILEQLEAAGQNVDSMTIPRSPYDLHVRITGRPFFVKFNLLEDPKQQVGSYLAVIKSLDSDRVVPNNYIDVRAGERVYYR